MPCLNMDNRTTRDCQLSFRILQTPDMKEVLPQIKLRVDPQVSFTQSHEGRNMQDSIGSQVVKLEVEMPQKRAEEPVWWYAEPPLVERHKGHHISVRRAGNAGSTRTRQASSFVAAINPCFMSFCRWLSVMVEGVQSCSAMARERREGNTFEILVFPSYFFFSRSLLFSSLFLFSRHREGGKERTADDAQGYRGAQG
jgi:hypothetical protein